MPFTKITETDLQNKGVIGLPDTPGLSTTEMQEKFDEIALDVLTPKHNGLIDELALSSAAANIGALDVNNEASTVQAELNKLKQGGYTKAETDALLANKVDTQSGKGLSTNDFTDAYKDKLNGIEDNANNYVLPKGTQSTIGGVMGDGTTFTIDTNGVGHAVGGGGGGTSDYNALINKPKINNVEVIGDKSGSDFGFLSPVITITSDAGSTVKIKKGTTEIDAVPVTTTTWKAVPSDYGTWTVSSTLPGADEATGTVTVDAVKQYSVTVEHITATITATYPNDATYCTCSKGSTTYTATSNPQTFTVRATGTWTVETSLNGIVKSATTTITADGDSQSVTIEYADIEVTYDNNFKGKTITCTNGTLTYTKTAPNDANTVTFTIPSTGTWTVRSEVSGTTYSQNVSVSSYTSYSASLAVFNATITITFPYSNGATCTCNSETATSSPYTFNIGATGTYTATCTLDGVSKTQSFTITTDGQTESHTFEYGTINLTFDNEFRGLTLTCTDSSYTITKTAPSTGNTMVFYPNETNTWTISGTYSGVTYTTTATVSSLSTPVSAILQTIPDGSTVTPTDAIQTWLKCAAINDKNYTTLAEVLDDTDTFTALLQDSNACDYMARSTTWAVASGLVPVMTDNTHPSGVASASTIYNSSYDAYKAFNGSDSDNGWLPATADTVNNARVIYHFDSAQKIAFARVLQVGNGTYNYGVTIQGSNDGSTWQNISSEESIPSTSVIHHVACDDSVAYSYVCMTITTTYPSGINAGNGWKVQFYADADITTNADAMARIGKYDYCSSALLGNSTWANAIISSSYADYILNYKRGLIPIMTSDTTPSGVASSSTLSDSTHPYYAMDNDLSNYWYSNVSSAYLAYEFPNDVNVNVFLFRLETSSGSITTATFSMDYFDEEQNDWVTIENFENVPSVGLNTYCAYCNITAKKFRIYIPIGGSLVGREFQVFGEAQTNIIHSAASDTLYYIDGTNQTIGTTDTSGVGTVDWSNVPVGNLTIYSSVAHDPDDLTSAYSKTVRITPNTVEVYVMPDNALYWWGYERNTLSSSGYTLYGSAVNSATKNTNNISLPQGGNAYVGIGTTDSIDTTGASKIKAVGNTSGNGIGFGAYNNKTIDQQSDIRGAVSFTTSGLVCVESALTPNSTNYFLLYRGDSSTQYGNVYALWYE